MANSMSMYENIIILCGHYKGVDQRVRDHFITKKSLLVIMYGGELGLWYRTLIRLIPEF
jgi:tRNA (guanine37-N1)-methyltransferase